MIVDFITDNNLSFRVSRTDSFRDLLNELGESPIALPATKTFVDTLKKQYDEQKQTIIAALAKCRKVCTTCDLWSKRGKCFIGMTAHYIDESTLERHSFLIAFRRIKGRAKYDKLAKFMYDIHNEYRLSIENLTYTITDGGTNFCKSFREYGQQAERPHIEIADSEEEDSSAESTDEEADDEDVTDIDVIAYQINMNRMRNDMDENEEDEDSNETSASNEIILAADNIVLPKQMRCFSHKLNIVMSIDFEKDLPSLTKKAFRTTLRKLRRVWGLVGRSTLAREIVQRICGRMLVIPNDTRWNALYDACKVVLSLRDQVSRIFVQNKLFRIQ